MTKNLSETVTDRHAERLAKLLHEDKVPDDPTCVADYKLRNGIILNGGDAAAEGSTSQRQTSKLDPVVVEQVSVGSSVIFASSCLSSGM